MYELIQNQIGLTGGIPIKLLSGAAPLVAFKSPVISAHKGDLIQVVFQFEATNPFKDDNIPVGRSIIAGHDPNIPAGRYVCPTICQNVVPAVHHVGFLAVGNLPILQDESLTIFAMAYALKSARPHVMLENQGAYFSIVRFAAASGQAHA